MQVRFWGVRGSIPTPGADTVQFGGNTACVSVTLGPENEVVFDAGTGLRVLGLDLVKRPNPTHIHLFLSHVHWDHIQGFPFFAPVYMKKWPIRVHGRGKADYTLGRILAGQMEGPNFPVELTQLEADLGYADLNPGQVTLLHSAKGELLASMHCTEGRHPNGVLVYRLEENATGKSLIYATDTEHPETGDDDRLVELAKGADAMIYDGMYTPEEYESHHKGWGHSTWEKGFAIARAAGVKQLIVFHHDPSHSDAFLATYEKKIQAAAQKIESNIKVTLAREGMSVLLA